MNTLAPRTPSEILSEASAAGRWGHTSSRLVAGLGVIACAAIIGGTSISLWRMHADALSSAQDHLSDLSRVLADQTLHAVNEIDAVLLASAYEARRLGKGATLATDEDLHRQLIAAVDRAPHIRSLVVTDATGKVVETTLQFPPPEINLAKREYFRALAGRQASGLLISDPESGPPPGEWMSPFSRRIDAPGGRFAGVITAWVSLRHFEDLYATLNLGSNGSARLFSREGVLLVSHSSRREQPGISFRGSEIYREGIVRGGKVFRHVDAPDLHARISSVREVKGTPLAIAVTQSEEQILEGWLQTAWIFTAMAAGGVLAVLITVLFITRQLRRDAKLQSSLMESRQHMQLALESPDHGIFDWDLRNNRIYRSSIYRDRFANPTHRPIDDPDLWKDITHPEDRDAVQEKIDACIEGRASGYTVEARVQGKSDPWRWTLIHAQVLERDENRRAVRVAGTVTDITEMKQAQEHLRTSQARLNAILDSAMDAVITVDSKQKIVLFNTAAEQMFRCTRVRALGADLSWFIPARFRDKHRMHVETFGVTGQTGRKMGELLVLSGLRGDGEEFPIDASISHVTVGGEQYFTVILRDITERKRAEQEIARSHQQLRELSRAAQEALESERRRIARELHDELGQSLTALKMDLDSMRTAFPAESPALSERAEVMRGLIDRTVAATRRISSDLRPLILDDLGLAAALDWLVQNFSQRTGISTNLYVDDAVSQIGEPLASALYRVAQESLTNVARHAQATSVDVRLERIGDYAQVMVSDNGRGIAAQGQEKSGGFGLMGIRERAYLLGGEAHVRGAADKGTTVQVRIPLAAAHEEQRVA